ncbi:hypothetical protein VPAL9027_02520 [Vibrio palustris]|uniref:Uncharacterized protein n=1 Tax=Vibrio palustris TaxID=1918946 RepID=A0A1R4B6N4_9VIBR|nr:hypothetical protein VPAL9027_02520 [Vibrio palustris]
MQSLLTNGNTMVVPSVREYYRCLVSTQVNSALRRVLGKNFPSHVLESFG